MSRFSEGECDSNYGFLWASRVERIVNGRRGQKVLRELIDALLALPERRLIAGAIATPSGEVCAVGALAKHKGIDLNRDTERWSQGQCHPVAGGWRGSDHETAELGASIGMTWTLAWEIGFMNDAELLPLQTPRKSVALDVPLFEEDQRFWSGDPNRKVPPREITSAYVPDYDAAKWARGYTPEERWQAVYDWACSKVRWNLPVAA